jgi:uncharacterized membrane protein YeaQ/YmgE (transglycosylase-associated protein family)
MGYKSLLWILMIVGSTIGGFIPSLWGADFLSFSSLILSSIGAIVGIWLAFTLTH